MGANPNQSLHFIDTRSSLKVCLFLRLKDNAERAISDEIFGKRSERWPEETPDTKETYFIRDIFDSEFVWRLLERAC